jgi:hypothetical protein
MLALMVGTVVRAAESVNWVENAENSRYRATRAVCGFTPVSN